MLAQRLDQRTQQRAALPHPVGQRRAFDLDALAGVDAALTVERKMVTILRHQHVREQARTGQSPRNRARRGRRLHDGVALCAGELGAHVTNHAEARRHILQHLAHGLAQFRDLPAATGALALRRQVLVRVTGQMLGKRLARWRFLALVLRRVIERAFTPLGALCFELFKGEFELAEHLVHLLGAASKLHATQLGDYELQVSDLGGLFRDPRAQNGEFIKGRSGGTGHAAIIPIECSKVTPTSPKIRQTAHCGAVRIGRRQSMPSSNIDNCAGLNDRLPWVA